MKPIDRMTQGELAAYIDSYLREKGINVVLSGGATAAVYTDHAYVTKDLDFIAQFSLNKREVSAAMKHLGFEQRGRYYHHPETPFFVEFISGPPSVGQDPIEEICEIQMETGILRVISPTDSVKDRLSAFFHWGDLQCLEQALMVSRAREINLDKVESWSIREGKQSEFEEFLRRLRIS